MVDAIGQTLENLASQIKKQKEQLKKRTSRLESVYRLATGRGKTFCMMLDIEMLRSDRFNCKIGVSSVASLDVVLLGDVLLGDEGIQRWSMLLYLRK
jgi:hypothetical protein